MDIKEFALRLSRLRINKGVSAREMSLDIGQSAGYINNIEVGMNFPSMTVFFYICEYLGVTPSEFFETECRNPVKVKELKESVKGLKDDQLDNLIALAKGLKK